MNTHAQRRRQQNVLRRRQSKNDVNTGALGQRLQQEGGATTPKAVEGLVEALRRAAERDLV